MAKSNSFSQLRKKSSNFQALQDKIKSQGKKDYSDDRFWMAERDKAGSASAVIRFLPAAPGEEEPWVKLFSFSFKGPTGKWFIENCPSTIGKDCPVLEANSELWNTGTEENQKIVRDRKRRLSYISNILVVKDPANPANEGKVFLFKFGQKIFDKIKAACCPEFEDETPIDVFNPWEGANFKLRIVTKDSFPNYDNSVFDKVSPISESDEEIEKIWNSQYPLNPLIAEDQFKSYDELKKRFEFVIKGNASASSSMGTKVDTTSKLKSKKSVEEIDEEIENLADIDLDEEDIEIDSDELEDFKSLVG